MKTAKKFSDPTTGGHQKASPPTASSPFRPVVGVANPFQAEHFKQFCLQLDLMFDPMDRIHLYAFYPSDPGKGEHPLPHDLAILEKALHRRKLFYHDKEGQRCLLKCHTFTTRRGSKMLWSIFKKLTDFNQLGYEIFIQPSIMSGISRISYAVAVSRFAILESDVMPKHDQLIFAQKHPEIVFAIYTGNKSLHSYIRLPRRIHNPDVIFGWRALSTAKGWKPCEHLDFKAVTSRIRTWALANGYVEPDNLITDCGHMVRIAGFRHRNGGYSRLLTRDMLDSIKSPMNQANIESSGQKRSTYSLPEVVPHSLTSLSLPSPGGLSWGVEASSEKCSVKCATLEAYIGHAFSRDEPSARRLKMPSSSFPH